MPIYTINKMTFNSADIEKSGSHPSPRHTYRFTSEKGVDFILPCISDSGNARTLVAQDLLEEKSIEYYEADADEHLIAPNGTDMHISGCVMLAATFKKTSIYVDALVSDDISQEIIVSCYDGSRIGAISIADDDWPASVSLSNVARICAINKGVPPVTLMSKEDIRRKIDYWCEKFQCIREKLPETNSLMKGPPMIIHMKDNVPANPTKVLTAATFPRAYDEPGKELIMALKAGGQIESVPLSHKSKFIVPKGGDIKKWRSPGCRLLPVRPIHYAASTYIYTWN